MIDPDAKIRITWPGFCKEEDEGGKGKKDKSTKEKKGGEGEGDAEDCGCCHVYPCRNWCTGVKACCLSCAEALGDIPRCACFQVRCCCGKLGRFLGGCLATCLRLCGGVFSVIVTLVGSLGMLLMLYFLYQAIFNDDDASDADAGARKMK